MPKSFIYFIHWQFFEKEEYYIHRRRFALIRQIHYTISYAKSRRYLAIILKNIFIFSIQLTKSYDSIALLEELIKEVLLCFVETAGMK